MEIHAILIETLGEYAPSYATVKKWVVRFKHGDFSTCDTPLSGRPKTVPTPEIIDQIHELILEKSWISAKSIIGQPGITRERVGSIIYEDLDMRKLSANWVPKCPNSFQKHQRCQSFEQIWNFFGEIQMISCRDWWPWTKPGYITMTWRQSNNQWNGGIAAHPAQKNSECKNQLEKFSPRFFLGIKTASSWLIIFERAKLLTRSILHLCCCNRRIFWRKSGGKVTKAVLFLHDNAPAHRALATLKKSGLPGLPVSSTLTLFSGSGPVGLPPVPWTEKKLKIAIFRPTWSLLPRRPGRTDKFPIFLNGW